MTVKGIDIASYQPTTYNTSGLAFVVVKATEGTSYTNPKHKAQVDHARAAGLVVGHYHFARPGSMADQAAYFLTHAAPAAGDVLAFDWEDTGVSNADKDTWIKHVQASAPGHRVLLYCNKTFWLTRDTTSFAGDGLWIADPDSPAGHPAIEHEWVLHQYSSTGGTDRNVANFASAGALKAWAAKDTTPATPSTPQEDDAMPTAKEIAEAVWTWDGVPASRPPYANDDYAKNPTWVPPYALQTGVEAGRQTLAVVKQLTAQVAALTAAVGALAKDGGLTAEQVQAAAEAGAQAALAELGDALKAPATDG